MLKGIGPEYDRTFLNSYMVSGGFPEPGDSVGSNWVVLSRTIADMLGLEVGSRADVYFMQSQVRIRRLTVTGIYETGFLEYDPLRSCGCCSVSMTGSLMSTAVWR